MMIVYCVSTNKYVFYNDEPFCLPIIQEMTQYTRKHIAKPLHRRRNTTSRVYSHKDYNSNDGMLTTVWGPGTWHFLHTMSFNYPVNPNPTQKRQYRDFVLSLRGVLPCGKCRHNLTRNLRDLPLRHRDMKSRTTFSKYMYRLHEKVNKMLGKSSGLTYADVRDRYEHFRSRCNDKPTTEPQPSKKESGCTNPMYGKKSKCILKIVPTETKCETLQIAGSLVA